MVQKLAQQAASKRSLGRFAKLGAGAGARAANPFQGARFNAMQGIGRPQTLAARGLGQEGVMQQAAGPAVHVQPPAALPTDYLVPDAPQGPAGGGGAGTTIGGLPGGTLGPDGVPTQELGVDLKEAWYSTRPGGESWSTSQSSPSSPLTIGGLIPLGGGLFLDPTTGSLHGSGLGTKLS